MPTQISFFETLVSKRDRSIGRLCMKEMRWIGKVKQNKGNGKNDLW
jgi:hypothetical protein